MKIRKELSGIHFFDRKTGMHFLFDENRNNPPIESISPRTVSIALTNVCDLKCHFCYAPKTKHNLELAFLKNLCCELDELGVLEITLGGGEPLLYPHIVEFCRWVWDNTKLGINITTHGHHLTEEIAEGLVNKISSIRFSIDGVEPRYSLIRGKSLESLVEKICSIQGKIPFGINAVVSPNEINEVSKVLLFAQEIGASNILLIPQHDNGKFLLNSKEWKNLEDTILGNKFPILITDGSDGYMDVKTLNNYYEKEFLFAHISADRKIKKNSYDKDGFFIEDIKKLNLYFKKLKQI